MPGENCKSSNLHHQYNKRTSHIFPETLKRFASSRQAPCPCWARIVGAAIFLMCCPLLHEFGSISLLFPQHTGMALYAQDFDIYHLPLSPIRLTSPWRDWKPGVCQDPSPATVRLFISSPSPWKLLDFFLNSSCHWGFSNLSCFVSADQVDQIMAALGYWRREIHHTTKSLHTLMPDSDVPHGKRKAPNNFGGIFLFPRRSGSFLSHLGHRTSRRI